MEDKKTIERELELEGDRCIWCGMSTDKLGYCCDGCETNHKSLVNKRRIKKLCYYCGNKSELKITDNYFCNECDKRSRQKIHLLLEKLNSLKALKQEDGNKSNT